MGQADLLALSYLNWPQNYTSISDRFGFLRNEARVQIITVSLEIGGLPFIMIVLAMQLATALAIVSRQQPGRDQGKIGWLYMF